MMYIVACGSLYMRKYDDSFILTPNYLEATQYGAIGIAMKVAADLNAKIKADTAKVVSL